jgi:RimJ/RimL family protein N-acetyltransferase
MEKTYLPEKIEGTRLFLMKHSVDLAPKMYHAVVTNKARLNQFLSWPNLINCVENEVEFIHTCNQKWQQYEGVYYGIYHKSDFDYMGNISSFFFNWSYRSCEIGYWLLQKFEGKGFMSESVQLLEDALFAIGFHRLVIRCQPENLRSSLIPKRLNYHFEGTLRDATFLKGQFKNLDVYSKLQSDL